MCEEGERLLLCTFSAPCSGAGRRVSVVFWCLRCRVFLSPVAQLFWHCQVCSLLRGGGRALGKVPPTSAIVPPGPTGGGIWGWTDCIPHPIYPIYPYPAPHPGVAGRLSAAASPFPAAASRFSGTLGFGSADAFLLRQSSRDADTLLPVFPTDFPDFAAPASHHPRSSRLRQ